MNLINLSNGTSIKERIKMLLEFYKDEYKVDKNVYLENVKRWRSRPTLVEDKTFDKILKDIGVEREQFGLGVKKLSEEEKEYIFNRIREEGWAARTIQILSSEDVMKKELLEQETINFTFAMRFHMGYLESEMKKVVRQYKSVDISKDALSEFVANAVNSFQQMGMKTFIYDMHARKEEMEFRGTDDKDRFQEFLMKSFADSEGVGAFLNTYPALARIYAETIQFYADNFRELIEALDKEKQALSRVFHLNKNFSITGLNMGAGDTHEKGKTVAILTVDHDKKIVFKPKNLAVSDKFDQFLMKLHELDNRFEFYKIKKIIREHYTFEEMLSYKECHSITEISNFYRRFGHTIALAYLLCGNDFHLENLIAHGEYPVLIDLETIIQIGFPFADSDHAIYKILQENMDSVVMTGLIPVYLFEEKVDKSIEGADEGLQLSALSGKAQKLPYKVLKIVNFDTDNMRYEYQEHTIDGSENIPKLNGELVDFKDYTDKIIEGYQELCQCIRDNKEELLPFIDKMFRGILVRNVIKMTQNYGDVLEYSTHPTCMINYIEREKLFENLWAHNYKIDGPVPYEIRDLLRYDIPVFYNKTDSDSLYASDGELVEGMYQGTAIDKVLDRIKGFTQEKQDRQMDYLLTSFGIYKAMDFTQVQVKPISQVQDKKELYRAGAASIIDKILEDAVFGEDSIAWMNVEENIPDNFQINAMNENLYDGITGLYLAISSGYYMLGDEKYKEAYEKAEKLVLALQEAYVESKSAFFGSLSAVYPLMVTYKMSERQELLDIIEKIADFYLKAYDKDQVTSYDWTGGTASIIKIYTDIYKLTGNKEYIELAMRILLDMDLTAFKQGGYAHGYSGVIGAAAAILETGYESSEAREIIKYCLEKERATFSQEEQGWLDYRMDPPRVIDFWCYGSVGIGMARLELLKIQFEDDMLKEEVSIAIDRTLSQKSLCDCICHGFFGDIEFLYQASKSPYITEEQRGKIETKFEELEAKMRLGIYTIEGLKTVPKYGIFTGLAGLAYEILRLQNAEELPNVLTLDITIEGGKVID
jgi:type 2 lantibiotic biosynthesis protein LanM